MSALRPWLLAAVLGTAVGLQLLEGPRASTGFSTMPILSPVSVELEAAMRKSRGQATPINPRRAVRIVQTIEADEALAHSARTAVGKRLDRIIQSVGGLRDARDRRHALNVEMMDVGVQIAAQLTPAQWAQIHMHRDTRDGLAEVDTLRRLRTQLQQESSD